MHAIIVFDRKQQEIPTVANINTFLNVVVFSCEDKVPIIYIDYVSTHNQFSRGGMATTIMNVAQHCCAMHFNSYNLEYSNIKTYINCTKELITVYLRYGFDICDVSAMKDPSHEEYPVYAHFDINSWYKKIYQTRNKCYLL